MEVTIAVQNVAREITIETDLSPKEVHNRLAEALSSGSLVELTDAKGKQVLIPGAAIGWVQIGEPEKPKVGFGAV